MNPDDTTLKVREIFYTLQGEGARAGQASIFIRLAGCNKSCWFCDTDWSFGRVHTITKILERIEKYQCRWIVWTGGEPTLQLSSDIVRFFREQGYKQAIETNGTNKVPAALDWISCSPKVTADELRKTFGLHIINEFRFVVNDIDIDSQVPKIEELPQAEHYYLSPLFLGEKKKMMQFKSDTLMRCVEYIKANPKWELSIQQHKLWGIP